LEIVFSIILPYCKCLPEEKKDDFHEKVDRSSVKAKVTDLVTEIEKLIEVCKHEEYLKKFFNKQKLLALFVNYVKLWKDLAFIFTIVLNIFIIFSFSDKFGSRLYFNKL
jgi:hypothetical protein